MKDLLAALEWTALGYFVCLNLVYFLLLIGAARSLARQLGATWLEPRERLLSSRVAPRISVLAPAYNESATVVDSVRALLTLRYPSIEVVLVNDGSSDDTLDVLQREFELVPIHPIVRVQVDSKPIRGLYRSPLHPSLVVVDKPNGGKADALNAGLNVATGTLVCAADADTLIEPDALLKMIRPFLERDDVVAVGATIRVVNASTVRAGRVVQPRVPRSYLAGVQTMEYLRAFLFGRLGWNHLGGNLIISGAFGLFQRERMLSAGGYLHGTVGEDMELVARLRRLGVEQGAADRVEFVAHPVAWTEVPESLGALARQRDRWHRGLADVLWRYRRLIGRPRYGVLGLVVLPYFVGELLAPLIEAAALLGLAVALPLGAVDLTFAVMFFLVPYSIGLLLNAFTLLLEEHGLRRYERIDDRLRMLPWALLEGLGYHQLTVVWRVRGLIGFVRGRTDWGSMTRRGFATEHDPAPAPVPQAP
jgi:cellulose synthase/poly-beta-1,6-N-acetylglucosamine synthase-like glycosyltransferase